MVSGGYNFAVLRYDPAGTLDATFDQDGKATADFDGWDDQPFAVAIDSDGTIVVAGSSDKHDATEYNFAVARFGGDGTVHGKATTDFGGLDIAYGVAIQADGKIIASGSANNSDYGVVRYSADLSLDNSFDGDGKAITDFASDYDEAHAVALQKDGKIVAAGYAVEAGSQKFALARYNTDGSLDSEFSGDGRVITDLSHEANSVTIQNDGKIVVAGYGPDDFALVRYEGTPLCIFCDDFNDGVLATNWIYRKGIWSESGGVLTSSPHRKAIAIASPVFSGCATCTLQGSLRTAGGSGNRVWLLGWYLDSNNYIELLMKEESDKWVLKQHSGGVVVAKQKGLQTIQPNTDYDAEISFDGTNFQVTINGQLLITMPKFGGTSPSGTVGFQVKATTGSFDFISVL